MDWNAFLNSDWLPPALFLAGMAAMLLLLILVRAERARMVRAERDQRGLAEALRDTAAAFSSTFDSNELLDRILVNVSRVVPNDAANIMLLEAPGGAVRVARLRGYPEPGAQVAQRRFMPNEFANLSRMLATGRPVLVTDTARHADWVTLSETQWIRSAVSAPIRTKGQTLGFLNLDSATPDFFTETHAARLQAFADQAAIAIENARLFEQIRRHTEELALINRIFSAFAASRDLPKNLAWVAEELGRALGVPQVGIALFNSDPARLNVVATYLPTRESARAPDLTVALKSFPAALQAFVTRAPIVVPDSQNSPLTTVVHDLLRTHHTQTLYVFPIVAGNDVIGMVGMGLTEANRTLTPNEMRLAETVILQTGAAIHNATLFERTQRELAERKQAEAALRESEARFRIVTENSLAGVYIIRNGRLAYVNPALAQAFGYTPEEMIDRLNPVELIHPDDRVHVEDDLRQRPNDAQTPLRYTVRGVRKDGSLIHCEVFGRMVEYEGQRAVVGTLIDMTERAQAEEQLRLRTTALETAANAVLISDRNGVILWVNPAFEELTGYTLEEVIGQTPKLLNSGVHSAEFYKTLWETILAGEVWRGEIVNRRKDGRLYSEEQTITPVQGRGEGITHFIAIKQDVTDRKQRDRERESLLKVAAALRVAQTRAEILPVLLDQLLRVLNAESAAAAIHDAVRAEIVVELGQGGWARATGLRFPEAEGVSGAIIQDRQPYLSSAFRADPRASQPELAGEAEAAAGVPLIAHDNVLGVLWIGRPTAIAPDELRLLAAIGDMAANALHRATLHEQTERRLQRLEALRSMENAILASVDVRATLNVLLDEVTTRLGIHAADVLLLDAQTLMLEVVAASGFQTTALLGAQVMLGVGRAGRAALEGKPIYIPNVTAPERMGTRTRLLASENFSAYYGVPLVVKGQIKGVLELFHREPLPTDREWLDFLEALGNGAAIAIDNAELVGRLQRSNLELAQAYETTLEGWSRALDLRDRETEGHTRRVTEMTVRLARAMGIDEARIVHMRRGALLHDIGKMGIPDNILLKTGPLNEAEWIVMRQHPVYAYEMLSPIEFLRPALDIPYCHHERWDGKGYPRGLKGEQTPLAARIFAVVDVWDALRSGRPYRESWPEDTVREYIRSHRGSHFDPAVVDAFLSLDGKKE